jgi:hypothetical protein
VSTGCEFVSIQYTSEGALHLNVAGATVFFLFGACPAASPMYVLKRIVCHCIRAASDVFLQPFVIARCHDCASVIACASLADLDHHGMDQRNNSVSLCYCCSCICGSFQSGPRTPGTKRNYNRAPEFSVCPTQTVDCKPNVTALNEVMKTWAFKAHSMMWAALLALR